MAAAAQRKKLLFRGEAEVGIEKGRRMVTIETFFTRHENCFPFTLSLNFPASSRVQIVNYI